MEQFGKKRRDAEREYGVLCNLESEIKRCGRNYKARVFLAMLILLIGYIKESKDIPEIPRNQRYVDRPSLRELFKEKQKINRRIAEAVYGYSQKEIAEHLEMH